MTRFFLLVGVLSSVVVACVAFIRRQHNTSEASSALRLLERPHLLDETQGKKEDVEVATKEEEAEEAEVKEEDVEKKDKEVDEKNDAMEVKEGELAWHEEGECLSADASSLGASLTSLRRFLHHARRLRRKRAVGMDMISLVEVEALSLHRLNLQLRDARSLPAAPHHHQVTPLSDEEGSVTLTVKPLGRGGGGYGDCGSSQALGVFNFLTFIVYSFSVVLTVLGLAQTTMADTFLGQVINGLTTNKRSFSATAGGMSDVPFEVLDVLGHVQQVSRSTRRHPRDTGQRQKQEGVEALRKELSVGLVTALLDSVQGPEWLRQESRGHKCSSPLRVWARHYFTSHVRTFLSNHT